MNTTRLIVSLIILAFLPLQAETVAPARSNESLPNLADLAEPLRSIPGTFDKLVASGAVTGAQVAVSREEQLLLSHAAGRRSNDGAGEVTTGTLFLIASNSKPFASATILRMLQDEQYRFSLNDEITQWLPAYSAAQLEGGEKARRAPTLAELLCHRAGFYSQKVKLTPEQGRLLYTFEKNLADGVDRIAAYPLLSEPGSDYAYSGAGYCVLGRVAELIAGDGSFEALLQDNVCVPLGLTRTTYFPAAKFDEGEFATGFMAAKAPHRLGDKHLWPLIGGSLYSTAEEMVRFCQGMAGHIGTKKGASFLTDDSWKHLDHLYNPGKGYTLGWSALRINGKAQRLSHSGSLQGYRSFIAFDRRSEVSVAATWTLPNRAAEAQAGRAIREALTGALDE